MNNRFRALWIAATLAVCAGTAGPPARAAAPERAGGSTPVLPLAPVRAKDRVEYTGPVQVVPIVETPSPEAEAQGARLVAAMLDSLDLKAIWGKSMDGAVTEWAKDPEIGSSAAGRRAYARFSPWLQLFAEAGAEEYQHDRPRVDAILGHYLAQRFTVEELHALNALLDGPYAAELLQYVRSVAVDEKEPTFSPGAQRELKRFDASPVGVRINAKFALIEKDKAGGTDLLLEVIAELGPGVARRWGEKAEAAEQARRAAGH